MYAGRHAGSIGKIGKLLTSPGALGLSSWRNITPHCHLEVISGYFCYSTHVCTTCIIYTCLLKIDALYVDVLH